MKIQIMNNIDKIDKDFEMMIKKAGKDEPSADFTSDLMSELYQRENIELRPNAVTYKNYLIFASLLLLITIFYLLSSSIISLPVINYFNSIGGEISLFDNLQSISESSSFFPFLFIVIAALACLTVFESFLKNLLMKE